MEAIAKYSLLENKIMMRLVLNGLYSTLWNVQFISVMYIPSSSQIEENTIIPQQLNIGVWFKLELFSEANLDLYYFNRYN